MLYRLLIASAACALLASCATPPTDIAAVDMPASAYRGMSCHELDTARHKVGKDLSANSKTQQDAATGDAVGVLLIGVPIASLGGEDKSAEIAVDKGKLNAINARMRDQGCVNAFPAS